MTVHSVSIGAALTVVAGMAIASAQMPPTTVDGLVSAAKVAAGTDWQGTFTRLCIPPPAAAAAARWCNSAANSSSAERSSFQRAAMISAEMPWGMSPPG